MVNHNMVQKGTELVLEAPKTNASKARVVLFDFFTLLYYPQF